jgi:hypothetical protein
MSKLLSQWMPSEAAINLVKLNGITDAQIEQTVAYLKNRTELEDIDDVDGYDNWNAFFIMFCIKANKTPGEEPGPRSH